MRTSTFNNKFEIVYALNIIKNEDLVGESLQPSRYLKLQLVKKGFLEVVKEKVPTSKKPIHKYVLTPKGKTYLNFSKNWKK